MSGTQEAQVAIAYSISALATVANVLGTGVNTRAEARVAFEEVQRHAQIITSKVQVVLDDINGGGDGTS